MAEDQVQEGATAEAPKEKKQRGQFSKEQVAEIRALRAETDAETGKPVWSHAKLAERFDTKAGVISHIVRNLSYSDPDYTPVNDINGRKADA